MNRDENIKISKTFVILQKLLLFYVFLNIHDFDLKSGSARAPAFEYYHITLEII